MKKDNAKKATVDIENIHQDIQKLAKKHLIAMEISNIDSEFFSLSLTERIVVVLYRLKIDFRATPLQCLDKYVGRIFRDGKVNCYTSRTDVAHEFRCFCEFLGTVGFKLFEFDICSLGPYTFLNIEDTGFAFMTEE